MMEYEKSTHCNALLMVLKYDISLIKLNLIVFKNMYSITKCEHGM